ncbi:MAG: hypothetical protein NTV34_14305 [Proteobacteria bacterium]|nr:hypothetical protein [Pseudomonadota bacterium]
MTIQVDYLGAACAAPAEIEMHRSKSSLAYDRYTTIARELAAAKITPQQPAALLHALTSQDSLALVGDERSFLVAAVVIPALSGVGLTAVISPSMDSLRRAKRLLENYSVRVGAFDLAPTKADKRLIWESLDRGEIDVILASPGRLASLRFRDRLAQRNLKSIVVTQAHLMSPWSHRFNPAFRQVASFIKGLNGCNKSAHIWSTEKTLHQDVHRILGLKSPYCGTLSSDISLTPTLTGLLVKADEERLIQMEKFFLHHDCQGVIYVGSVKQLYDTKKWLESLGEFPMISRPAMDEFSLQKVRSAFEQGETRIVVSQGAFLSTLEQAPGVEFIIFNGLPNSLEYLGQEIFAQESASPIACLCLSSEHDYYNHRFAIDKNYPDALTMRACFQGVKDAFGSAPYVPVETLLKHVKVATPFTEDDITQCLDVMHREGLIETILDTATDSIVVKMSEAQEDEGNFWHQYPLRKLEQISKLERTRDFLTSMGDLGSQLRGRLKI